MSDSYHYHTEPMKHQANGTWMLARNGGGGLLWDPGTGKTKAVVDYLGALTLSKGKCLALVVCPLSAVDTWPDEIDKHLPPDIKWEVTLLENMSGADKVQTLRDLDPAPGLHVVVVNFDVFSQRHLMPGTKTVTVRSAMADAVRSLEFDVGIVDESHRIKGHSSNVSRSMGALASDFPRRIILTGTVAPHSPLDIFAQWRWLNPERFGTRKAAFEQRYARFGGYRGKEVIGFRNQRELREKMAKDSMSIRKEDVLDLPPVTDQFHHVTLTTKERRAYDKMEEAAVLDLGGAVHISPNALTKWLRLRQLTSGYITDDVEGDEEFGRSKIRYATDLLRDLVEAGEKVVVFAHFRRDVEEMAASAASALSCPVEFIHGGTPNDERRSIRKDFLHKQGPRVVVAQMRTVSLAVNELVAASQAIYLSMSERRDDYIQSRDRLNRKGQTRPITFHHLVVPDTIDEVVYMAHEEKGSLESYLLDYIRNKTTTEQQ